MNAWELIFMQSPANNGCYEEDELPQLNWTWPKGTWFQGRLDYIREHQPALNSKSSRKISDTDENANDVIPSGATKLFSESGRMLLT